MSLGRSQLNLGSFRDEEGPDRTAFFVYKLQRWHFFRRILENTQRFMSIHILHLIGLFFYLLDLEHCLFSVLWLQRSANPW